MEDAWDSIFTYLPYKDVAKCEAVSKTFRLRALRAWARRKLFELNSGEFERATSSQLDAMLAKLSGVHHLRLQRSTADGVGEQTETPSFLVTATHMQRITQMPRLRRLIIQSAMLENAVFNYLDALCPAIEELSITNCNCVLKFGGQAETHHFQRSVLRFLRRCTNLRRLHLQLLLKRQHAPIWTQELCKVLPRSLREFSVSLNNAAIIPELSFLRHLQLESLGLHQNVVLSLQPLLTQQHLTRLDLSRSSVLLNFDLVGQCRKLRVLNLAGCLYLTDSSLSTITRGCPSLCDLNISCCPDISPAGYLEVCRLPELERLSLSSGRQVDYRVLDSLASLPHLAYLDLSHCYQVIDAGQLPACLNALPSLATVVLLGIPMEKRRQLQALLTAGAKVVPCVDSDATNADRRCMKRHLSDDLSALSVHRHAS